MNYLRDKFDFFYILQREYDLNHHFLEIIDFDWY